MFTLFLQIVGCIDLTCNYIPREMHVRLRERLRIVLKGVNSYVVSYDVGLPLKHNSGITVSPPCIYVVKSRPIQFFNQLPIKSKVLKI